MVEWLVIKDPKAGMALKAVGIYFYSWVAAEVQIYLDLACSTCWTSKELSGKESIPESNMIINMEIRYLVLIFGVCTFSVDPRPDPTVA
jgi:hypothetical protein